MVRGDIFSVSQARTRQAMYRIEPLRTARACGGVLNPIGARNNAGTRPVTSSNAALVRCN